MARFKYDEADRYGSTGNSNYFFLKDDGDTARVRFMYNSIEDIEGLAVHEVTIGDRKRYVNCLRNYNDPVDVCPFCRERMFQTARVYIPLYDEDEKAVKVWERGKTFLPKLTNIAARYSNSKKPLVAQVFDIQRLGKKGDTNTTYEIFPVGEADNTVLEDLPELPNVLGTMVLDKTAEDMEYFLESGEFPPADGGEERTVRRSEQSTRRQEYQRRTPANTRRNDRF